MSKLHSDLLDQKLAVWPNNQCFYRHLSPGLDASQSEKPRYPTVWEWWEVPGLRSGCACGNMHVRIHMCKHVYVCTHIPLGHRTRKLSWKNYRPEAGGGKLMRSEAALWYLRLLTMSALNAVHCLTNFLCPVPFTLLSCKQTLETWLALQTFRHLECFFIFFKAYSLFPHLLKGKERAVLPDICLSLAWFKHGLRDYLSIKYMTERNRNYLGLRCFRWQFLLYTALAIQDNTDLLWSLKRF